MISQNALNLVNPFSKPIPGQSLTRAVDDPYPWEGPPEFTRVDEAIDAIVASILTEEGKLTSIIEILGSGEVPISAVAQIILENGFRKGKFNPDLMLLLAEPLMVILMALAERAGIHDYEIYRDEFSEMSEEEQMELANDVINSYKEEVNFRGLRSNKPLDVRSVSSDVLEQIEEADIPQAESLMAKPENEENEPEVTPVAQPSLLERQ